MNDFLNIMDEDLNASIKDYGYHFNFAQEEVSCLIASNWNFCQFLYLKNWRNAQEHEWYCDKFEK